MQKRAELGNRAKFSLINSLQSYFLDPKLALRLFDTLVSSVLFYGVEVWGYLPFKYHIEVVHISFLRQFLGVRRSTHLLAIYGESGRLPLFYFGILRMLRYWSKFLSLPGNRYSMLKLLTSTPLSYNVPTPFIALGVRTFLVFLLILEWVVTLITNLSRTQMIFILWPEPDFLINIKMTG